MKLNSILIEGDVATLPTEDRATGVTTFALNTENRKDFGPSSKIDGSCCFHIHSKGKLADIITKTLKLGNAVRVVGYLASDEKNPVYIFAEHIEIKPVALSKEKAVAS